MDLYICLMEAKEKALRLCQQIAMTSFDTEFNNGTTLPLELAKKIALICVDEILLTSASEYEHEDNFWRSVKEEINKL